MRKDKNTTTNTSSAAQTENTITKNVAVRTGVKAGSASPSSAFYDGVINGESFIAPR